MVFTTVLKCDIITLPVEPEIELGDGSYMKKLLCAAAACALMLTGVVGCGKDDDSSKSTSKGNSSVEGTTGSSAESSVGEGFEGKWECSDMTVNGTTMKEIPLFGIPLSAAFQIEIMGDGTYKISTGIVGATEGFSSSDDAEGTWEKVDDDTIRFNKPEGSTEATESEDGDSSEMFENVNFDLVDGDLVVVVEEEGQKEELKFVKVSEFSTYEMPSMNFDFGDISTDISINVEDITLPD